MASRLSGGVWSDEAVAPAAIEAALRDLLIEQSRQERASGPTRVCNLVVIVDREWRGEIANRLERVGRYHPSRTIVCAVEAGRARIDARAALLCELPESPSAVGRCREEVEILVGPRHLRRLDTIVDPIRVPDVDTVVWSPHGHPEAVDALLGLAHAVLIDSIDDPDVRASLARAGELAERAHVVDLAWLRSAPWRERLAAAFDPPPLRPALREIAAVTVRHHPDSAVAGVLVLGWLASRLGWEPGPMVAANGALRGRARARKGEVVVRSDVDPTMTVPGLAGVTVATASGAELALDRGPGGLTARRRARDGREARWTLLGASRGEAGILGDAVRQALLSDSTYPPALAAARAMVG